MALWRGKKTSYFKLLFVISGLISISFLLSAQNHASDRFAAMTAEEAVFRYFRALNRRDCQAAGLYRLGEAIEDCRAVKSVDLSSVALVGEYGALAIFHLKYKMKKMSGSQVDFDGLVTVQEFQGDWVIDGTPFGDQVRLEEYINRYHPHLAAATRSAWRKKIDALDIVAPSKETSAPVRPHPSPGFVFGDARVLERCFSPGSLAHGKGEEIINRKVGRHKYLPRPRQLNYSKLPPVPFSRRNSIRSVSVGNRKLVALTFDFCEREGEVTGYDGRIIDYLRKHGIKATLYMGGKWMATHESRTMQLIADPLFELGNHGWTHGNLRVLKGQRMRDQINWTQAQYEYLRKKLEQRACYTEVKKQNPQTGLQKNLLTLRYPYGTCSREALRTAAASGLPSIQWNVVTADPWRGQTVSGIVRATNKVRPGSIVIMHGNGRGWKTSRALPRIVRRLRARGYRFVTVTELLDAGQPRAANSCYEVRPGDNRRYDRLFGTGTTVKTRRRKHKSKSLRRRQAIIKHRSKTGKREPEANVRKTGTDDRP